MIPDYHSITEIPGLSATTEQIERLYHRYRFALDFSDGKRVLEVACGSGMGLKLLSGKATVVAGGDIDASNLHLAASICEGAKTSLYRMDAHCLPFKNDSFDTILLFESIYYLKNPEKFVRESARVLRNGGHLIIGTVNKSWNDFHPSPFAQGYFSVPELRDLLAGVFPHVQMYGVFPVQDGGVRNLLISFIKRIAVQLRLIPGSLAARAYLKRLFIGPLQPLPLFLQEGMMPYPPPEKIAADMPDGKFKIVYAVAWGPSDDKKGY
jgi:ubiquinone/menaquinone biosynthesis C-methylase UbiE